VLQRHPIVQSRLHYRDVNFLYEAAYLRMFVAWEDYLDRAFVYLLCGRHHADGIEPLRPGVSYAKTLSESQQLAYGGRDFALWHNPEKVIERARRFFLNGRVEQILASD